MANLLYFAASFFAAAVLPGMNMLLVMSFALSIGFKKAFWLIFGQTTGIALTTLVCAVGIGAIILNFPQFFTIIKICGGLYLLYTAYGIFRSTTKMHLENVDKEVSNKALFIQGLTCSISNPLVWVFLSSLLPKALSSQPSFFMVFLSVFLASICEFIAACFYALGGATFKKFLSSKANLMSRISAIIIGIIALILIFSK